MFVNGFGKGRVVIVCLIFVSPETLVDMRQAIKKLCTL